jgi:hypothetical protein
VLSAKSRAALQVSVLRHARLHRRMAGRAFVL